MFWRSKRMAFTGCFGWLREHGDWMLMAFPGALEGYLSFWFLVCTCMCQVVSSLSFMQWHQSKSPQREREGRLAAVNEGFSRTFQTDEAIVGDIL